MSGDCHSLKSCPSFVNSGEFFRFAKRTLGSLKIIHWFGMHSHVFLHLFLILFICHIFEFTYSCKRVAPHTCTSTLIRSERIIATEQTSGSYRFPRSGKITHITFINCGFQCAWLEFLGGVYIETKVKKKKKATWKQSIQPVQMTWMCLRSSCWVFI